MIPPRLSFVTYNIWATKRWPEREPALRRFLELFAPDVLCLQELQRTTQAFLDAALPTHDRVHDPLPGWTNEGNIYWNKTLLEKVAHGAEEIGHIEPERRLFWARLRLKQSGRTVFVSTAHLTSTNSQEEMETGKSPRVGQLQRVAENLARLVQDGEPAVFMGDMNDPRHPQRILGKVGYVSCFAALGLQSPPTYQAYPTVGVEPGENTRTEAIDLIVANRHARAIAAAVPQCYAQDMAPSDHWPVQAVYELAL